MKQAGFDQIGMLLFQIKIALRCRTRKPRSVTRRDTMALRLALGRPAFSSDQIELMLQDKKAEKRDRVRRARTHFSHDHDE